MPAIRRIHILLTATAIALLAGCGTVKNTVVDGDDQALMLRGNDPVAYFSEGKQRVSRLDGFNSQNARLLEVSEMAEILAELPYVQSFLRGGEPDAI